MKLLERNPFLNAMATFVHKFWRAQFKEEFQTNNENQQIVQLTENGNEIGNQVNWHQEIQKNEPSKNFEARWCARVAI